MLVRTFSDPALTNQLIQIHCDTLNYRLFGAVDYQELRVWNLSTGVLLQTGSVSVRLSVLVFMPEFNQIATLEWGDMNMYISDYTTLQVLETLAVKRNLGTTYNALYHMAYRPGE